MGPDLWDWLSYASLGGCTAAVVYAVRVRRRAEEAAERTKVAIAQAVAAQLQRDQDQEEGEEGFEGYATWEQYQAVMRAAVRDGVPTVRLAAPRTPVRTEKDPGPVVYGPDRCEPNMPLTADQGHCLKCHRPAPRHTADCTRGPA